MGALDKIHRLLDDAASRLEGHRADINKFRSELDRLSYQLKDFRAHIQSERIVESIGWRLDAVAYLNILKSHGREM